MTGASGQGLKWGWAVLGGLLAHLCTVAVVALSGVGYASLASPASGAMALPDATRRAGLIVGPTIGTLLVFAFGRWAARRNPGRELAAGTLTGALAALILTPLLVTAPPAERIVYLASMGLKLAAGAAAGRFASKRPSLGSSATT